MNSVWRNLLAVLAGMVIGFVLNSVILMASMTVFPISSEIDPQQKENFEQFKHLLKPQHYLFVLAAHGLGTLVGAYTTSRMASVKSFQLAMIVGAFFLVSGLANHIAIAPPIWFMCLDLLLAYIPMAWLGHYLVNNK